MSLLLAFNFVLAALNVSNCWDNSDNLSQLKTDALLLTVACAMVGDEIGYKNAT